MRAIDSGIPDRGRRAAASFVAFAVALTIAAATAHAQEPVTLPPPPEAVNGEMPEPNVGVLRPGDMLKITVYRDPELTGDYPIDSRGYLQVAGLGMVQAAGLTPAQVMRQLETALVERGYKDPELAVQPLIRVSVLGQVGSPGLQLVDPGTNLVQLLALVGGPAPEAKLSETRVIREGRTYVVDLEAALQGSASGRVVLYSNDVVVVPQRFRFRWETVQIAMTGLTAVLTIVNFFR